MKGISREVMNKREEKDLFSEFAEDFNTSTLKHEKYYDLDKWERKMAAQGDKVDELAGKTDEERIASVANTRARTERRSRGLRDAQCSLCAMLLSLLRSIERQRARATTLAAHENARIQTMKLLMQQERASGTEAWQEIQKRQDASLKKATFESIAKQREQDKKDAEMLAKQKRR